jgi:hypothetical protein
LNSLGIGSFNFSYSQLLTLVWFTDGNRIQRLYSGTFSGLFGISSINSLQPGLLNLSYNYNVEIEGYFLNGIGTFIQKIDLRFCNISSIPDHSFSFPNSKMLKQIDFIEGNRLNQSLQSALFSGLSGITKMNTDVNGLLNFSGLGQGISVSSNFLENFGNAVISLDISRNGIRELPLNVFEKSSLISIRFWNGNRIRSLIQGVFNGMQNVRRIDSEEDGKMDLSLKSLYGDGYSLQLFPYFMEDIGDSITSLDLSNNNRFFFASERLFQKKQ